MPTRSNSGYTNSDEKDSTALPEQFVSVIRNLSRLYRVRLSNNLPLDLMTREISTMSSGN